MAEKVVLAFSGGLGTIAALDLLKRRFGQNIITFTAQLGQKGNTEALCERAVQLGAGSAHISDLREPFVQDFVWPAVRAGAVCESGYALAHALARPLIVKRIVEIAREEGAQYIAHGCASKSNDQVRFEVSAAALAPELRVLAPLREHGLLRQDEVRTYCRQHQLPTEVTESRFSITDNLYGSSVTWDRAPDSYADVPPDVWARTRAIEETPYEALEVQLSFERGTPVGLDGEALDGVRLLERLADMAGQHGVGRLTTVEDRLIGIRMIEVYEQPAATVVHTAREALARIVLSPGLLEWISNPSRTYADLAYKGFWFSELREALDAFFLEANRYMTGDVRLRFYKGHCRVIGVRSRYSLYSQGLAAPTTEGDQFAHSGVRGYLETISQATRMPREARKPRTEATGRRGPPAAP